MSIKNLNINQDNLSFAPKLIGQIVTSIWIQILCEAVYNEFAKRFAKEDL